ncbi:MAG: GAF domain-containing protein [Gammaproteobacteria bacterium]|nr:GAF domain-containing protein [Gammaproteobacteria bacterium]
MSDTKDNNSGSTPTTSDPATPDILSSWKVNSRALVKSGLFCPIIGLLFVVFLLSLSGLLFDLFAKNTNILYIAQIILLLMAIILIGSLLQKIQTQLIQPLSHLREWAQDMRKGNLSAKVPVPATGDFTPLAEDINTLGEELSKLSRNMGEQVAKQTERVEQKNRSLEILYDVAASINISRDLDDLLVRFLRIMNDVVNAKAATLRLVTEGDQMRLISSVGLSDDVVEKERLVSTQRCLCGKAFTDGELLSQDNVRECSILAGHDFFEDDDIEMIAVPLQYRNQTLGVYNLFVEKPGLVNREDIKELLVSIGRHMGMAIEKSRLDAKSNQTSIIQERNLLSSELHDSLAQTLASLKYQVANLDDSITGGDEETAEKEIAQIENTLNEAYTELRELIAHFRAPFDERGLVASIDKAIDRFRKETGTLIFFQNEWKTTGLPSTIEMQVLRIVQESLNNIRKHSKAHAVRVLLRNESDNQHLLMIEDDGIGIGTPTLSGKPGEHVGLSIMKERAQRIGGKLKIESESGEGTQIILTFNTPTHNQRNLLDLI